MSNATICVKEIYKYCVDIHILEEFKMKKFNVTVNGTAYDVEVNEVKAAAPAAAPKAAPAPAPAPAAAAAPVPAGAETVNQTVSTGDDMVVLG